MPGLQEKYIAGIANIAAKYSKPIVMCDIGETEMALYTRSRFDRLGIPAFSSPEDAARAMKALVTYGVYLKRYNAIDEYVAEFTKRKAKQ